MSIVKFELKKEHITLLTKMSWGEGELDPIIGEFEGDYCEEEMGIIIYGKPEGEFDPNGEKVITYTEEQLEVLTELKEELPIALDIVLGLKSFEVGHYKRKFHLREWAKYEPK